MIKETSNILREGKCFFSFLSIGYHCIFNTETWCLNCGVHSPSVRKKPQEATNQEATSFTKFSTAIQLKSATVA